jgi:ATP-binding cassette subfamily B protein
MILRIKKLLDLTDVGYSELKRAIFATLASNLTLLLEFGVIVMAVMIIIEPLLYPVRLEVLKLPSIFAAGLIVATTHFFAYRLEYQATYTAAYNESAKIRLDVAERLRKLPLSFYNHKDLTELTTNIMGDVTAIEHTMSHVVPGLVAHVITAVIAVLLLAVYDLYMALALFAPLPIALGLIFLTSKIQTSLGERHVKAKLKVADEIQEYLEGIKVVKAHGLSGEKSESLVKALKSMRFSAILFEGTTGSIIVMAMMILQVGVGLVVFTGVILLTKNDISIMKFLTFAIVSARIYSPLIVVFTLLPEFFYMLTSTKRMRELKNQPIMGGDAYVTFENHDVVLKNVSFSYKDRETIKDLSITFPQNSLTALVGPSGSGKSTILRLVARFWDVDSGQITVGGRDVKTILPEELLKNISVVFQDVTLFNDSIMNNIRVGRYYASDAEVKKAAYAARCDEFIESLPNDYDTVIGENGVTLSGGERGRISIARALLKGSPIVLLDEATASLDPENEDIILSALRKLITGRTVIVIAHSIRTVMAADHIAVIDDGKLVEYGNGEELIQKNGLFKRLYDIQTENRGWSIKKK